MIRPLGRRNFTVVIMSTTASLFSLWTARVSSLFIKKQYLTPGGPLSSSIDKMLYSTTREDMISAQQEEESSKRQAAPSSSSDFRCDHCSNVFPSRNALFRHIRKDPECSLLVASGTNIEFSKQSIAMMFGYSSDVVVSTATEADEEDTQLQQQSEAEAASAILQYITLDVLRQTTMETFNLTDDNKDSVELISTTQSSLAKLRHPSLKQETPCAAAADVFVASLMAPTLMNTNIWKDYFTRIQQELQNKNMNLVAAKVLDKDLRVHAERSCSQRIYHYLLPLSWLPDGEKLQDWWKYGEESLEAHNNLKKASPPPDSLRIFKKALRSAESQRLSMGQLGATTSNDEAGEKDRSKQAAGRFGALGARECRPWHNYADPNLRGDASPNTEIVWKVIDKARIVHFVDAPNGEVVAVLEFRGDDFLHQQVRRIVGTTVAISHGWLPEDFLSLSTKKDTIVETVLAPEGRLYVADTRFHFEEMKTRGQPIFDVDEGGTSVSLSSIPEGVGWIQERLLQAKSSTTEIKSDTDWLQDVEDNVTPRIRQQIERAGYSVSAKDIAKVPVPSEYSRVLALLREIIMNDQWPETSAARSSVIRDDGESKASTQYGSFTVINPQLSLNISTPLGNDLFPDLTEAIFELEEALSKENMDRMTVDKLEHNAQVARPPSSHCAVNCRAAFLPHVDSGRGAGQSLSMIVGLGDYVGGEIMVEGKAFDIRFKPIEFDGWKLRHWTNQFHGERFSLVWFSPEMK